MTEPFEQGFLPSPQQRRVWRLQTDGAASCSIQCALRIEGDLDRRALRRALAAIVERHEILRTAFRLPAGLSMPLQVILEPGPVSLPEVDLRGLAPADRPAGAAALLAALGGLPFDLARGEGWRAALVRLGPREHELQFALSAACADPGALEPLAADLLAAYGRQVAGGELDPEPPLQYVDVAQWQNSFLEAGEGAEGIETWREYWKGHDIDARITLPLPLEESAEAAGPFTPREIAVPLGRQAARALARLAEVWGCSPQDLILSAWKAVLQRGTGRDETLVGVLYSGREAEELRGVVGPLARYLPIAARLSPESSLREAVAQVRQALEEAESWAEYFSWEHVTGNGHRSGGFPVCFEAVAKDWELAVDGLRVASDRRSWNSALLDGFALALSSHGEGEGLRLTLRYDPRRFRTEAARRLAGRLAALLGSVAARPEAPLADHPALSEEELGRWLELSIAPRAADHGREGKTLAAVFEEQVDRTPQRLAVVAGEERLTFRELDRRANRLAHHLRAAGAGPEVPVALCLDRSAEAVTAVLAVWKAGAFYVPLDPTQPAERLAYILADTGAPLLVTDSRLAPRLPGRPGVRRVLLDEEAGAIALGPADRPAGGSWPHSLAYAIYTSGSTGRPKGVQVEHRSPLHLLAALEAAVLHPLAGAEPLLASLNAPMIFDASVQQLVLLLAGHALCVIPEEVRADGAALVALLREQRVDLLDCTPSQLRLLVNAGLLDGQAGPRLVLTAGEAVDEPLWRRLAQADRTVSFNLYGPTECSVDATFHRIEPGSTSPTIGRPLAGYEAFLLDRALQPVPPGAPGELCLGGAGLARGYLGRPELTAGRFVPHPFASRPGERLYRTGDLGRQLPDGNLEFLGRLDFQVKIRGFRIELGEIEKALAALAGVRDAVVVARQDRPDMEPGDRRLVAYVVGDVTADALRDGLRERLPDYMVPAAFVSLAALPLTPNGKVDRAALPAPEWGGGEAEYVAPRTPVEEILAGIWAELLGLERVGAAAHFFELGGHSLLATQVMSRLRGTFDVEMPLRTLFEAPVLADLAARIEAAQRTGAAAPAPPLAPVLRQGPVPLSFAQQRLWFIDQLEPGTSLYNIPVVLRAAGPLRPRVLALCLGEIVRRHEALRTVFAAPEGAPVQVIQPAAPFVLPVIDLSGLAESRREALALHLAGQEAGRPFDLARGPLLRGLLLRLAETDHVAALTLHHIVSDGWSMGILVREVTALYAAYSEGRPSPLEDLPIQYGDFAVWQRQVLQGEALAAQVSFWRDALRGLPTLELPTDRPRPPVRTSRGGVWQAWLPAGQSAALARLARDQNGTLFMVLLAGFAALLSRWTGQDDVVVGSTIANRNRSEVEGLIGFFVNTLVLRTDCAADPDFGQLLDRVRKLSLAAFAHQDLPFEKLVEELAVERDPSRTPLFQVLFALQNAGSTALSVPGLTLSPVATQEVTAKFDLTLSMTETPEGLYASWQLNRDLFDTATVTRMAGHLEVLFGGVLADPGRRLSELPLLNAGEQAQLLREWNDTEVPCPQVPLVHELFAAHARQRPLATALAWPGGRLTYGELDRQAGRLARHLRSLGVGPETLVALCTERTCPERVVGIVAVLLAGGAYVSLDPAYPQERLAFLLADSRAPVVLTQERLAGQLPVSSAAVIALDGGPEAFGPEVEGALPDSGVTPDNLAYVVYTSGSTGRPKGVEIPHSGLMNLVRWHQTLYGVGPEDRGTQVASPAFDASIWELWPYLAAGSSLHIPDEETRLSAPGMLRWWAEERITLAYLMTPLAEGVLEQEIPPALELVVRALIIGGDRLRRGPRPEAGFRLMNHYGPAEYTVTSTVVEVPPEGERRGIPSIGRPIDNTRIHVLDRNLNPVPVGVLGELFVAGVGLARGYLGRPDLTAEKFVPDPFAGPGEPGARIYRTGDLVRYLPDGDIDFQGRLDHQVKLRGLRIELGEIEAMLGQHPQVREATVLVREDRPGDRRLVAYVVPAEAAPAADDLRDFLREHLPGYMVPAAFVVLAALPLTPNGKVDRRALPAPERQSAGESWLAPRTPVEEVLAGIWAEVLGLERVGAADSFFELGGHSLLATRVMSRLRSTLDVEMPLRDLFEAPVLADFAARVETARRAGAGPSAPPLVPVPREGPLPLSFAQQRLWFIDQLKPGASLYSVPVALRVEGPLQLAVLELCLGEILRRHEALRTVFAAPEGTPVQVIQPAAPFVLPVVDLSGLPESRREALALVLAGEEAGRPFDLGRGPLLRGLLLRLAGQDHIAALAMHHIVSDGWSMGILVREVMALYRAFAEGRPSPLPELPLQYADFAVWQNSWLSGEVLENEISYWRRQLAGLPPLLEFPTDRPRPEVQSYRGGTRPVRLPAALTRQAQALGRREGATLFMVLLAAFQTLLARYSGQQDLAVGSPIAGRNRTEIEGLIGFFVNTAVLRGDLSGEPSFRELLGRVRETALAAYLHQDMPFEKLVLELTPERSLAHSPLFQVMFVLQNAPAGDLEIRDLRLRPVSGTGTTAKFDFTLNLVEWEGELVGTFEHATDLFDGMTMDRLAEHFQRLLAEAVAAPEGPVWELPLLGDGERQQTQVEWNDSVVEHGVAPLLSRLLEEQAARAPEGIAVEQGSFSLTYGELEARANRLAHLLRLRGVTCEDRVAICCERSPEMVVSQLAVWKAGAAWVPLEPSHPAARRAVVLDDARPVLLIAGPGAPAELLHGDGSSTAPVLDLAAVAAELAGEDPGPPAVPVTPGHLAYVIYTSGSTGRPKGVLETHGAIANRLLWMRRVLALSPLGPLGASDAVLQKTPFVFDAAIWEMALPLLTGSRLVLAPPGAHREPAVMAREVLERGVTVLQLVPSVLGPFLDEDLHGSPLRRLFCGGEALPAPLCRRAFERLPGIELRNLYGPTECAIDVTSHPCRPGEEGNIVPLGRPLDNLRVRILDHRLQPVPAGQPGELYAGGIAVARGYLNRPDLTAERFVPDPLGSVPGGRLYRTGDLVRALPGGEIQFLGRLDDQVKIRGLRIELGEIEAALSALPEVSQAVVVAREDVPGDQRLVAYVVRRPAAGDAVLAGQPEAAATEHVAEWQTLYEETYGRQSQDVDPTFNTEGWNSSYTGEPIPAEEMREWVDSTVERILALGRRRVLELGCGAGLLLFRIAPQAELYLGTDFSRVALDFVQRHLDQAGRAGRALPQVVLAQGTADDWAAVPHGEVDLVIINSVAQYFPDVDYLVRVLERAVRALATREEGGAVFLGDLRSLPLLEALHASVELYQAAPSMTVAELRRRVRRRVANEEELVVDPELFFALARRLPEIRRVEVLVKRGRYHNELTRFRYDVVLHVGGPEPRREAPGLPWIDWRAADLSLSACERLLAAGAADACALTGIPNARLAEEGAALALLRGPDQDGETVEDLRRAVAERLSRPGQAEAPVDPEEIWALGERLGYAVELTWAGPDGAQEGRIAAVLRRRGTEAAAAPVSLPAAEAPLHPWSAYANDPLRGRVARRLVPELRRSLQVELPEYMIPSSILLLDSLPITPNGKVDRNALPAPEIVRSELGGYVPPRTPTEERVGQIWAELLGLERVGAGDHFFELGGHSLMATQVISRLRSVYGVEMPVRDLFAAPVLEDLAARVDAARQAGAAAPAPPLVPAPRKGPLPLSFAQQRLWFVDLLKPGTSLYNVPVALRAEGRLHLAVLELCLDEIVRRHEVLRTVFAAPEGSPVQVIQPAAPFVLPVIDLSGLPDQEREALAVALAREETGRPFDLARGPLLRSLLLRLAEDRHIAVLTLHHIVSDGWSMGILVREVMALYGAFLEGMPSPLPELAIQYADFAVWQRGWLGQEALDGLVEHWRRRLAGAPSRLDLPGARPRPAVLSPRGAVRRRRLSPPLLEQLHALGRRESTTLFITLMAPLQALLHARTGATDLVVGTDVAGRDRRETEGLIGFFINQLPLRADLAGNPSLRELLGRVRETALEAYAHQDVPFDHLVEALRVERSLQRSPVFQVKLVLQNTPQEGLDLPGLTLEVVPVGAAPAQLDLHLNVVERGEELWLTLTYSTDLYDEPLIDSLLDEYEVWLRAFAERPEARLGDMVAELAQAAQARKAELEAELKSVGLAKLRSRRRQAVELDEQLQVLEIG